MKFLPLPFISILSLVFLGTYSNALAEDITPPSEVTSKTPLVNTPTTLQTPVEAITSQPLISLPNTPQVDSSIKTDYVAKPNTAPPSKVGAVKKNTTPEIKTSTNGSAREKYLHETKDAQKDDRKKLSPEYGSTMHHAEVDSKLILNRYENKQFIKEKIEDIAKSVVKKEIETKKSIADQMGSVGSKRISVSIDETVSIKDAIIEVSNLANIDVEIDPEVEGSIILSVKNTQVADVLERMADLARLNISVKNNVVRFMANKSFTKYYSVSFIDNMNSSTNNSSSSTGVGGNQNTNPYNNQMVGGQNMQNQYGGGNYNNNQAGYSNNNYGGSNMYGGGVGSNSMTSLLSSANQMNSFQNNSMWDQFENGLKYIVSQKKDISYSVNKQAGVVTLRAPLIIHKEIEEYIEKVKKVATTQILVEVRLVEVQLNDEFSTGINFGGTIDGTSLKIDAPFSMTSQSSISKTPFALTVTGGGLVAAVQFLQSFGTTKAIASPRLNVMNNQKSRLSFAKDHVYFSIQPQLQNSYINMSGGTSASTNPIIVQSTMQTVPIGVILEIQATADIEKEEITMNIHPVISSIVDYANDPAAAFLSSLNNVSSGSKITNSIPMIEKKELNSTLRIRSGDIMVIGGFNEEKTVVQRAGIPYLKDIPYLKFLFGFNTKSVHNIETVIFIKATIMTPEKSIGDQDVKFYNDFA